MRHLDSLTPPVCEGPSALGWWVFASPLLRRFTRQALSLTQQRPQEVRRVGTDLLSGADPVSLSD